MEWFQNLDYWHWWIFAVILGSLEILAPGAAFIWLGVSAAIVGLLMAAFPGIGWEIQFLVFSALGVISVTVWFAYIRRRPIETDSPSLNLRGQQYIGRTFSLVEPIKNGRGKIKIGDTRWSVKGPDLDKGAKVKAIAIDGTVIEVEEASNAEEKKSPSNQPE